MSLSLLELNSRLHQLEKALTHIQERIGVTEYVMSQALWAALHHQSDGHEMLSSFQSAFIKKLSDQPDENLKQTCIDTAERIFVRTRNSFVRDNDFPVGQN